MVAPRLGQPDTRVRAEAEAEREDDADSDFAREDARHVARRKLAAAEPLDELRHRLSGRVAAAADEHGEKVRQDEVLGDQRLKTLEHKARDALHEHQREEPGKARRHVAQQRRPKVAAIAAARRRRIGDNKSRQLLLGAVDGRRST